MVHTYSPAYYLCGSTQAVHLDWRGAAIGELAWTASRPYLGLRVVMKWLVAAISSTLVVVALWFAIETSSQLPAFVLVFERDLELTAALVLFVLLSLTVHYQVEISRLQKRVPPGLFLYSLTHVLTTQLSKTSLR